MPANPSLSQLIQEQLLQEAAAGGAEEAHTIVSNTTIQTANSVGDKNLTDETRAKYFRVATEFLRNGFNRTRAYMSVYPDSKKSSAATSVKRVLDHVEVQAFLKSVWDRMTEQADLDSQYIMRELLNASLANPVDYIPPDTTDLAQSLDHIRSLPNHVQRRLRQIKVKHRTYTYEDGSTSDSSEIDFKVIDAQAAIRDLAKIQGILTDHVEIGIHMTASDTIIKAMARAKKLGNLDPARIFDEHGQLIEEGEIIDGKAHG